MRFPRKNVPGGVGGEKGFLSVSKATGGEEQPDLKQRSSQLSSSGGEAPRKGPPSVWADF